MRSEVLLIYTEAIYNNLLISIINKEIDMLLSVHYIEFQLDKRVENRV